MKKPVLAIGLMSGTSLDGVDAALVRTDGDAFFEFINATFIPYPSDMRMALSAAAKGDVSLNTVLRLERHLTNVHAEAVAHLLEAQPDIHVDDVDVIGFHGQTIRHLPDEGLTWQIGDAQLLAARTTVPVISDFRRMDMALGGQGAPLVPMFHASMLQNQEKPVLVLNIGGVANITYLGTNGEIICGDTGPGVGLLDEWIQNRTSQSYDHEGAIALEGRAQAHLVEYNLMNDPFFKKPFPKSADRYQFNLQLRGLSTADGAATLCMLTARSIAKGLQALPEMPKKILMAGGGSKHPLICQMLKQSTNIPCETVETAGLRQDSLEAEAFAWLAVRRLNGEPTTLPTTTGCDVPSAGGVLTS